MWRRSRSSCCHNGLSLAELLLVMALLLVVMGLLAGLVREYSEMIRFAGGKSHTVDVAQEALGRMAAEVSEAARLDLSNSEILKLERINPALRGARLPEDGSGVAPDDWEPFADDQMIKVTYECVEEERLIRSVDGQSLQLADNISGISVSLTRRLVTLSISTREGRQLRSVSTCVCLPASLEPAP